MQGMTLRRFLIGIPVLLIAAWIALALSGYGILVRDDPMYANDASPPVVEDAACSYFDGTGTKTIFLRHQTNGAICGRWLQMRP